MSKQSDTVLLRNLDSHGHSKPFAADHAERLLAYPGTRWAKIEEHVSGDGSGQALPLADNTEKIGAAVPKPEAAAGKKKPAAAADSPAPDATGLPTSL